MPIYGNMIGGSAPLKTLIIEDENGNEMTGVVVGQEVIFDATDNDVREGKVYASDEGVSTGTKIIPSYHTHEGNKVIMPGKQFTISSQNYDYTKLQAIVCSYNTTLSDSVSAEQVAINDNIYSVQSTTVISTVVKDHNEKLIDFGITNNSDKPQIVRFFYVKEIY